jgi:hypothetical protein
VNDPLGQIDHQQAVRRRPATSVNPLGTLVGSALDTCAAQHGQVPEPKLADTTLGVAYSFGNVSGSTAANSSVQFMAKHDARPLQLGLAMTACATPAAASRPC